MDLAISPHRDWAALSGWQRDTKSSFLTMVNLLASEAVRQLPINDHYVYTVAFSPDGQQLASGSKTYVTLWDVESGRELKKIFTGSAWVRSLAYSPDGKDIATGFTAGLTSIFSARTGRKRLEFQPKLNEHPESSVLRFTPDGRYLFSTADSKPIQLFDREQLIESTPTPTR